MIIIKVNRKLVAENWDRKKSKIHALNQDTSKTLCGIKINESLLRIQSKNKVNKVTCKRCLKSLDKRKGNKK